MTRLSRFAEKRGDGHLARRPLLQARRPQPPTVMKDPTYATVFFSGNNPLKRLSIPSR